MLTAKLFKNGSSQAVRIPKEFQLPGSEVYIKRVGDVLVLIPKNDPWSSLLDSLGKFSEDFMSQREELPWTEREGI
jgi:antitoxin VapB